MYLSKNSRYVLRRAKALSPKFFRTVQNNLSVKIPKDDPSKPPLRINIPKDATEEEIHAKTMHTVGDGKTRNFTSISQGSSVPPTIDEEFLPKCENDIRFPNFVSDSILMTSDLNKTSNSSNIEPLSISPMKYSTKAPSQDDYNDGLQMPVNDKTTDGAFDNTDKETSTNQSLSPGGEVNNEAKNPETPSSGDPKSLYIIIDVPELGVQKSLEPGTSESAPETIKTNSMEKDDFEKVPELTAFKPKTDRQKPEDSFLKKSISKFPSLRKKQSLTRRFDISQIEEPATYVFHLRFNKQNDNKPTSVGRVPEKEFQTRNENFNSNYVHIRIAGNETKVGKHVGVIEEFPSFKPADAFKRNKPRKSEEDKTNLLRVSKSSPSTIPQHEGVDEASESEDFSFQRFARKGKSLLKKSFSKSERDVSTVKPKEKSYAFKLPTMFDEKRKKAQQGDETYPRPRVQWELSESDSAGPVYQNPKDPTVADTDKNPYEYPAQTSTAKAAQQEDTRKSFPGSSQEIQEQNADQTQAEPAYNKPSDYSSPYYFGSYDSRESHTQQTESGKPAQPQTEATEYNSPYFDKTDLKEQTEHENLPEHHEQTTEYYAHYSAKKFREKKARKNRTQTNPVRGAQQQEPAKEYNPPHHTADESEQQRIYESQAQKQEEAKEYYPPYHSDDKSNESQLHYAYMQEDAKEYPEYHSADESIQEWTNLTRTQQTGASRTDQQQPPENQSPYFSIHELKEQKIMENENQQTSQKPSKKQTTDGSSSEKSSPSKPQFVKPEKKAINFQTSSGFVSIGCKNTSRDSYAKFCAAFPPLLNEALNTRLRLGKHFFLREKPDSPFRHDKTMEKNPELLENFILFPRNEPEKFDCESLLGTGEETILNIIKTSEKEAATAADEKIAKPVEGSSTENENSVDSLTVMKKVKEIVRFDLDNVVKIFNAEESKQDVPSVVHVKDDGWKVDSEELDIQRRRSETRMKNAFGVESGKEFIKDGLGDKITEESHPTKYLPSVRGNEMKLDSVIMYDSKTDEFFINKDALAKVISQKTNACLDEVHQTLNLLTLNRTVDLKSGDSILVFDDETQSWKVDFSILEKREQQMKIEEELTKRSELILETFEQLERSQLADVPMPSSRDRKIFDYKKGQWNAYSPDKKTKESTAKQKYPFREADAEEIRKKNSDLYENLFVANKKETAMQKSGKNAPGLDPSKHDKKSKSYILADGKTESTGSGAQKGSETTPVKPPDPSKQEPNPPPPAEKPPMKKDDNFWESFLNMNILPRDIREIPPLQTPPPTKPQKPSRPFGPLMPTRPEPTPPTPKKPEATSPTPAKPATLPTPAKPATLPTPPTPAKPATPATPPTPAKPATPATPPTPTKPATSQTPLTPPSAPKLPETEKKIEEPRFKIRLPFIKDKKTDKPTDTTESKTNVIPEEIPKKPPKKPGKVTTDEKGKPSLKTPPSTSSSIPVKESPKTEPPPKSGTPKESPPKTSTPKESPPKGSTPKESPPKGSTPKEPPKSEPPLKIGAPEESPKIMDQPSISKPKQEDPKPRGDGKPEKLASATDHYVSDKIIEISRNKPADGQVKIKTNKVETVKVNITPDTRLPSKVTEINLNKKCEEKVKETQQNSGEGKKSSDGTKQEQPGEKTLYKNLEKYKTPFSEPEYEETAMKIKSDLDSNPNLKKLDNWNKTLVLQDIMKPPDNIESWLKDETDKMATLLLKVLQEASDGKPKKKSTKSKEKPGKGNPYDNIRKKQETTPENFLFRVRTVNFALDNDKKPKQGDIGKLSIKSDHLKDIPVQSEKTGKLSDILDASKIQETGKELPVTEKESHMPITLENSKSVNDQIALESAVHSAVMSREFSQANKLPVDISDEIPGPELLKKISNAWKVFPILGSQMTIFSLLRMFQLVNLGSSVFGSQNTDRNRRHAFSKLFVKYGPIVNVQGPLSGNVILIHNPEHLSAVFEQDVTVSVRSVFDSLEYSRHRMEDNGVPVAISTDWTKPEWNDLKKGTIDTIMKSRGNYFHLSDVAADSLVSNIRRNRNAQNCVSEDFMEEIRRWSLEGLCSVVLEKSFGFLERRPIILNSNMEPNKLHLAIDEATQCLNKCEKGFQLWRLMSTPSAVGLGRAYRSMSSIFSKVIYQAEVNLKGKAELLRNGSLLPMKDLTFLESMLLNDGMTADEITCNLVDIVLIGTNAMNSAMGFLLYNLAQNIKAQMKLVRELKEVLPTKDCQLQYSDLNSLKYLQACLKETLRLNFPVPIFYRLLQNDILLANYIVPKGTYIVMDFRVSSMKEQIFDDPDKFIPERWLAEEKWMKDIHPFGSFPLCHGPRAEMAKKVVEMQMLACIAKVVRNFQIEYQYGEIQGSDTIISGPEKPLKLNFVERES